MSMRDALWLWLFLGCVRVATWLADETTSHAAAPVHAIAEQYDEPEQRVGPAAQSAWDELVRVAGRHPNWAAASRGALFTGRLGQGNA